MDWSRSFRRPNLRPVQPVLGLLAEWPDPPVAQPDPPVVSPGLLAAWPDPLVVPSDPLVVLLWQAHRLKAHRREVDRLAAWEPVCLVPRGELSRIASLFRRQRLHRQPVAV